MRVRYKDIMIEYVKGEIAELSPATAIIDCNGLGYAVNISLNTYSAIQGKSTCKLYIYEAIREDAYVLYGFADKQERELFLLLISVSGIGGNTARMILSALSPAELVNVISTENANMLKTVKGIDLTTQENYARNVAASDVHIKVNVKGYSSASFTPNALDTLTNRGEEAALEKWDDLLKLKKKIGIPEDYKPEAHGPYTSLSSSRKFFVKEINFSGIEDADKKWMIRKCKLKEDSEISVAQLEKALSVLRGSQAYSNVSYKLTNMPEGYKLDFLLEEKYERNINLGIRFDSEETASVLLNATSNLKTRIPSKISVTGRLGKRYAARVDYTLEPMQMRNFNLGYLFEYNDINIYNHGDRAYNTTYKYHSGEFSFSDVWYKNLRFAIGVRFEYFKYKDFLYNSSEYNLKIQPEHFFSYFAQVHYNTFNKGYFPNKGADFKAGYVLYTDNLAKYKGHAPFSALSISWSEAFQLTNRIALLPSVYGRVLIGRDIPYPYTNALGGDYFGRFISQQMPFAGIDNIEIMKNSVVVGALKLRQRLWSKHYISLTGNVALNNNNFFDILEDKCIYGFSLGYGIDSMFGPLEASLGYSNQCKKVGFYVNLGFYF